VTTIGIIAIVIIAAISGIGTILTALVLRKAMMNTDSKNLVAQIERIGQSLGGVIERIERIGQTLEAISTRNEQLSQTFDNIISSSGKWAKFWGM
jgi:methyl-accepting chemotaxis protein